MTRFKHTDLSRRLGEAIKTLRTNAEMSQRKLAKKLGIDLIILKAIEEGEYRLTLPDVEKLSEVFKLRPSQIMALGETVADRKSRKRPPS
jgi:transcriptional regulator with XRE-family HTH domain